MFKVAILDDYQNVSQQFVDLEKLSGKYEFKIFSEPFLDEADAIEQLADFEALLIMRERTPITKNLIDNLNDLKFIITSDSRNKAIVEAEKSIGFLEEEISKTNIANAQKFLFSLIEQQTKNKMLASVRDEYVFEVIDPATVPTGVYRPNKNQIAFLGLFIGFFISYILGMFTHVFGIKIPIYSNYNNSFLMRAINKIKFR